MSRCPLVLVEWEDSRQPSSSWVRLSTLEPPTAVRCVSVGWLIHDGASVKALASNMGDVDDENSVQASGVIRIPARCITRLTELDEPELTAGAAGRDAHPETRRNQRASSRR